MSGWGTRTFNTSSRWVDGDGRLTQPGRAAMQQALYVSVPGLRVGWLGALKTPRVEVPDGFILEESQILTKARYPNLFFIIGNTYGGDGVDTFQLPPFNAAFPTMVKY